MAAHQVQPRGLREPSPLSFGGAEKAGGGGTAPSGSAALISCDFMPARAGLSPSFLARCLCRPPPLPDVHQRCAGEAVPLVLLLGGTACFSICLGALWSVAWLAPSHALQ